MDPNSNNPNDPNNPSDSNGFSWPSTPGGGLNQSPTSVPQPGLNGPTPTLTTPPEPVSPPPPSTLDTNPPITTSNLPQETFTTPTLQDPTPANISTNPPMPSAPAQPVQPLNPEPVQDQPELSSNMSSPSDPISLGDPNLMAAAPIEQPAPPVFNQTPAEQPLSEQASAAIGIPTQTGGGSEMPPTSPPIPDTPAPTLTETAPTDLSHLIGDNNHNSAEQPNDVYNPPLSQPENLVVPSQTMAAPESISATSQQFNLSKLLIIAGVILVLIVSGLSAYFILGVGRNTSLPTSVPAQEESSLTNPPTPIATPTVQSTPATNSAGFGSLQATPTPKANSAIDLIRQRQQSTPNPTLPPVPR